MNGNKGELEGWKNPNKKETKNPEIFQSVAVSGLFHGCTTSTW